MIDRIILFSIKNKFLIGLFTVAIIATGLWSMTKVPLDAVPDITNNQVQVITQAPNLGTEDIEQFVTYPVELAMSNLPKVKEIRSISRFGLSVVTIVFDDDMGLWLPRQLVSEKLQEVREEIPEGFGDLSIGPIATGLGEIYQYVLQPDSAHQNTYSLTELRTIQDWIVRRQMAMVTGVVEVNSFGGNIKQYEVAIDPAQLTAMHITMGEIFEALQKNNANTGGAYIEKNKTAHFIRGEGLARSIADIENIVVKNVNGIPLRIRDVAKVQYGSAIRYGAVTKNGKGEVVGGLIMMLSDANSNEVIKNVKERMDLIEKSLPPGLTIEPYLDRSRLIAETTGTIKNNLMEGALIVIFVLVFLLGNWRGGLIVASAIPLSLLFAFILMNVFGVWANLMSLGAIDFGIIVDGAVIIVEGTVFMLMQHMRKGNTDTQAQRDLLTHKAAGKMMNSAFFGQLIILIVFLPILFLEGVEGKMFRPMALTFMFAMAGAIILCFTYIPMMSALFLRVNPDSRYNKTEKIYSKVQHQYEKFLERILRHGVALICGAAVLLGLAIFAFTRMGGEFMPQLDEGDIAFHIMLKPGSSLSESIETSTRVEKILLENFPEIKQAVSRFGVADVPTDPMPMDMADCFVILKPRKEWVSAKTKEELIAKIEEKLSGVVGVAFEFSQPIEMRFNELITGVREDVAIKIYGDDLGVLAKKADEVTRLISGIEGIGDLKAEATAGLPQITVNYDRDELSQYGLNVEELNRRIETSFAGAKAGVVFEGEKRFDLVVRFDSSYRSGIEDLQRLPVLTPKGMVPLSELARVSYKTGPMQISRDNTNRHTYVGINVRGRDVKSVVTDIKQKLDKELNLESGYYIRYGGAFENLERATDRLFIVVPVSMILIFILIFFALRSFKHAMMIYVSIPLAVIGGVFSLWMRDMHFSVSAGIGFIVLFGIAVLNGLILISGWNELKEEGVTDLTTRIKWGAKNRIRPILLTALTDITGFLPMALSHSAGAEVQKPLATVVIGGMISATILTLFVLPVLYKWIEEGRFAFGRKKPAVIGLVVLAFCFASPFAMAQHKDTIRGLTLEQALQRSQSAYPQLKIATLRIDQEEAMKNGQWDGGATVLSTSGEEIKGKEGIYTPVSIGQQGIEIFGIAAKKKAQKSRIGIAKTDLHLSEKELALRVKRDFAAAAVAAANVENYRVLDSLSKQFERADKLRYELQETSGLQYLSGTTLLKQIQLQRQQVQFNYTMAVQRLNLWLANDTFFMVEPAGAGMLTAIPESRISPGQNELLQHPEVALAQQRVVLAGEEQKATKSKLLPRLNLEFGRQRIGANPGFFSFNAGVAIPLLNTTERANIKWMGIQKDIAAQELLLTENKLENELGEAIQNYRKWQASRRFYEEEALPLAEAQKKAAVLSYQEGEIDYRTFILLLKETIDVKIDGTEMLLNYLEAKYELEYFIEPNF